MVRNIQDSRKIERLGDGRFWEAAKSGLELIADEAFHSFHISHIVAVQRHGRVPVGDLALYIGVSSAYSVAAFEATRHLVDGLQRRVPIWKREARQKATQIGN